LKTGLVKLVLLISLALSVDNTIAATIDWTGAGCYSFGCIFGASDKNNWNNPDNWSGDVVPGINDDVRIGVNGSYTINNWPIIGSSTGSSGPGTTTPKCKSLTFGYNAPQTSYTFGKIAYLYLTINSGYTLTVTGNITQNHNPSATGNPFNYSATTIAGAGTLLCQGKFIVGDATTQPANGVAEVSQVSIQIDQLTITGNLTLNSNGNNGASGSGGGICYPYFSVEKGTTTLLSAMTFATNNAPVLSGYNIFNPGQIIYKGYGLFTADNTAGSANTVELQSLIPITKADNFYVYFTFGGNNGTTLYDAASGNQTVYTANEPSVTTSASYINTTLPSSISSTSSANYYNLTLSGASIKVVDGNSTIAGSPTQGLTVGGVLTTSASGAVNLTTNSPTVTVTGDWINSTAVNQGSGATNGDITIGGSLTNNSGGVLALGSRNLNIAGNYTNNLGATYTQSSGTTTFNGTNQTLTDNSVVGTAFNNVRFNCSGTANMVAGTGNFSVASTGVLTMISPAKLVAGTSTVPYLSLKSDAAGSASVAAITGSSTITGYVNVERYMNGGASKRTYKFLSAPVNQGSAPGVLSGSLAYGFKDLQLTAPISGYGAVGTYPGGTPPTNAFDPTPLANPAVLFYNEPDSDPINMQIVNSDYRGIKTIGEKLPIGNGFLFYFRGNRNMNDASGTVNKATSGGTPEPTTLNFNGNLNQGTINVVIPTNGVASDGLGHQVYTTPSTAAAIFSYTNHSSTNDGYHLVGNPYACSIDLDQITLTNPGSTTIYMLNNVGIMGSYVKGSGITTPVNGVGRYVLSGQGFFVKGNSTPNTTLSFTEACKVTGLSTGSTPTPFAVSEPQTLAINQLNTNDSSFAAAGNATAAQQPDILIRLALDSANYDETLIHFNNKAQNKYNVFEDAYYNYGITQTTFMATYSTDNKPLLINQMSGLDSVKTIPLYAEGQINGKYTMTFTGTSSLDPRFKLYLKDNLLKDSLDLSANSVYTFNIDRSNAKTYGASRFTLSVQPTNIAASYQLLAFNGVKNNNSVALNWKTQYEGNYTGFTLQRTTDNWKTITNLAVLQSDGSGLYAFTDTNPNTDAVNQYRLVQNNINGVNSFSNVVTVSYLSVNTLTNKLQVFPNPVANVIQVNIKPDANSGSLHVKIFDLKGELIINNTFIQGNAIIQDVSKLMQGNYVIQVNDNNKSYGSTTFTKL
jgi:hypothetical protein